MFKILLIHCECVYLTEIADTFNAKSANGILDVIF